VGLGGRGGHPSALTIPRFGNGADGRSPLAGALPGGCSNRTAVLMGLWALRSTGASRTTITDGVLRGVILQIPFASSMQPVW
jgi:hypothetical protein